MKIPCRKITPTLLALFSLLYSTRAESKVSLNADAQLSYISYSATYDRDNPLYSTTVGRADEKQISEHGSSLVQQYSAALTATNRTGRSQPSYYTLMSGYDWKQFNTDISDNDSTIKSRGTEGNFNYSGIIAYAPAYLSFELKVYGYNGQIQTSSQNVFLNEIISDGLTTGVESGGKSTGWGGTFVFAPERSRNLTLRGLPRLHIDYSERTTSSPDDLAEKTRELAVAGLNKENNWLHYRFLQYERNQSGTLSGYNQQAIQIGLIDYQKARKWSALTNWIDVSADGQLTNRRELYSSQTTEEYDLNFFAIATRRTWNAKTFLNFNRLTTQTATSQDTVESYRIPIYVKGIWGSETDWFVSVSSANSQEKQTGVNDITTRSSTLSLGGSTFHRSSFTFSPVLSFAAFETDPGVASYNAELRLESNSTGRFSNKWNLYAASTSRYKDDGLADGTSWNQSVALKAFYRTNSPYRYGFSENLQVGSGKEYINSDRTIYGVSGNDLGTTDVSRGSGVADYLRSITAATFTWTKSSELSTSLDGSYDLISKDSGLDAVSSLKHSIVYSRKSSFFRLDSNYRTRDDSGERTAQFDHSGELQYRPDSRNSGLLRYSYRSSTAKGETSTEYELLQKYSYNFLTRSGVLRNLATVFEELRYKKPDNLGASYELSLGGRYYPTSKISLYASVRLQSDPAAFILTYNTGASADFKLLTASVDYSLAKRDADQRTEQRIATTIRRSF